MYKKIFLIFFIFLVSASTLKAMEQNDQRYIAWNNYLEDLAERESILLRLLSHNVDETTTQMIEKSIVLIREKRDNAIVLGPYAIMLTSEGEIFKENGEIVFQQPSGSSKEWLKNELNDNWAVQGQQNQQDQRILEKILGITE